MTARRNDWPSTEDKLEALHYQLIEAVADLASSEAWMTMLRVAARFYDYSPSNVLLIAAQRPDATRVGGIRTWNSLGRHVLKGEHGIAILAPCIYRTPDDAGPREGVADVAAPGNEPQPSAREPQGDAEAAARRVLRGFKVVHVFDVTQTDGNPLPDVGPELLRGDAPEQLWDHLAGLVTSDGYRLQRGPCAGANGYTDYAARVVRVIDDVGPAQAVKTLAHELGHIRADHEHRFTDYTTSLRCRGQAEIEAESIAYLVTTDAGLDAANYSVPYLAGWSGGNIDLLRESMTRVVTTSRAICEPASDTHCATVMRSPACGAPPAALDERHCANDSRPFVDQQALGR
jgi:antirestriction protein ArdC